MFGSNRETKAERILSNSEMTRSVLIDGFSQKFVDVGYPELSSGLYYDNLGEEAKAIFVVENDEDEENAFRINAYNILVEAMYNVIGSKLIDIEGNEIQMDPRILEARLRFSDKLLEKIIIEVDKETLSLLTNYDVDLRCRYFWDRELTKAISQIESEANGIEIGLNKIPLASNDLLVTVKASQQLAESERKDIMEGIALVNPSYIYHYRFIEGSSTSQIIYKGLSHRIIDILDVDGNLKINYAIELIHNKE
jgi:hypothetical protein